MVPLHVQLISSTLRRVIKRLHLTLEVMLVHELNRTLAL